MDKQLLEQDFYRWVKASERLPSESGFYYIWSAWGKDIWNFIVDHSGGKWYNNNSAWAYNEIEWLEKVEAGATSSSTVKELEKENRQLINMYMELKADYDMLNEKYQQLSIPSAVEEPPVESWGIKDIKLGSYSLAIMFSEWLNIHCKPSNKLKDGKVAWNYYCPSSLRQLGRFTTEELYDIFERLNSEQNPERSVATEDQSGNKKMEK